jgi:hypothetical protein
MEEKVVIEKKEKRGYFEPEYKTTRVETIPQFGTVERGTSIQDAWGKAESLKKEPMKVVYKEEVAPSQFRKDVRGFENLGKRFLKKKITTEKLLLTPRIMGMGKRMDIRNVEEVKRKWYSRR